MKTAPVTRIFWRNGPVHAFNEPYDLAWCGVRPQYRHLKAPGTEADVTCRKCLRALKAGQPRAWRS